jgi:uncharacterized membrane protein
MGTDTVAANRRSAVDGISHSNLPVQPTSRRIESLDIVRGIVMLLMAIDHVRVYSGLPAGGPTPGIFFTRWVTHFCAPIFVFLAGTGIYLYAQKRGNSGSVARYLITRGAILVFLELTVLRLAWTFNFDYRHYMLAGVIWMIGWCMILMAGLVQLPTRVVAIFGVAIIALHNIVDPFLPKLGPHLPESSFAWFWRLLYFGGGIDLGHDGPTLAVLYVIIPWIGVMAAGYGFGAVMKLPADRRNRICYGLGSVAIVLFLLLRGFNLYGDPRPWHTHGLIGFLNTTKYPASLLFLLMTLGPMLIAIPIMERVAIAKIFRIFGRVPFFYYVLHIPLIHAAAIAVSLVRSGSVNPWLFANHPMGNPPAPAGYTWSLGLLYLVWAIVVALLYLPCRWFAELKDSRKDPWLSLL